MKNRLIALLVLFTVIFFSTAQAQTTARKFEAGKNTFLLDGKPFVVKAAELHYTRIPQAYWEHRIEMCKALGMNTICIYIFWNIHEQEEGKFDFSGQNDIAAFCRAAQKHGTSTRALPNPIILSIPNIFFAKILHISKKPSTFASQLRKTFFLSSVG